MFALVANIFEILFRIWISLFVWRISVWSMEEHCARAVVGSWDEEEGDGGLRTFSLTLHFLLGKVKLLIHE